ncbi:hypothetical protein HY772_04940 [Candidatus Woesearchaeota archaeon]|nr:hypothetical protein [Candidatus Woesearchaeota archaeon]
MAKKRRATASKKKKKSRQGARHTEDTQRVVHSPLHSEIAHPKDAMRIRDSLQKEHGLHKLYDRVEKTQDALNALHENHKPVEVKISEVLAKHARQKHRDRLMKINMFTARKSTALTIILAALVVLCIVLYLLILS